MVVATLAPVASPPSPSSDRRAAVVHVGEVDRRRWRWEVELEAAVGGEGGGRKQSVVEFNDRRSSTRRQRRRPEEEEEEKEEKMMIEKKTG